jgi:hypothetical protein
MQTGTGNGISIATLCEAFIESTPAHNPTEQGGCPKLPDSMTDDSFASNAYASTETPLDSPQTGRFGPQ